MNTDRLIIPSAIAIERDIIGLVLYETRAAFDAIGGRLDPDCFLDPTCRAIWETASLLDAAGNWTSAMVTQRLHDSGILDGIGGPSALFELIEAAPPSLQMVPGYVKELTEARDRRRLLRICSQMAAQAADMVYPLSSTLADIQTALVAISAQGTGSAPEHVAEVLRRMEADLLRDTPRIGGLATGFMAIDSTVKGMLEKQFMVVAARPSVGKSTLLHGIAANTSAGGFPTLIVTLEMSAEEIVTRMAVGGANVPLSDHANGTHNKAHRAAIMHRVSKMVGSPLYLHDAAGASITQIRSTVRAMVARHGIAVVLVDYLQLLSGNAKDRHVEVGQVSRGLKQIAKENSIRVIAAAQLGRQGDVGEPKMSHLRESGDIEQDADIVALMWRDDAADRHKAHPVQIRIAKNRNGPIGDGTLMFQPDLCKFYDDPEHL